MTVAPILPRAACALIAAGMGSVAFAQLRFVDYNVAGLNGDQTKLAAVIRALNDDDKPGFATAPHLYTFQEMQSTDTAPLLTLLNANAPVGVTYALATYTNNNENGSSGAQALYYRTDTFTEDVSAHADISTGAGRFSDRWLLRLNGYTSTRASFYVYSAHLKASNTTADANTRTAGAQAMRANADALGVNQNILFCGDWNVYSNSEGAYQTFIAAGNAQAIDPWGTGNWTGAGNAIRQTQSPCGSCPAPMVNGGMNDRFDFQLATAALNDNEGLSRLAGTYRTFGNDGNHYNQAINSGNNTYYPGDIARSNALAGNLAGASDHCPVVSEFQIPAKGGVTLIGGNVGRVIQSAVVSVQMSVTNTASVLVASGADELDFSATGSGAVSGAENGIALPLGPAVQRSFAVNTASLGTISGSISVTSSSEGAEMPGGSLAVSGTVIRPSNVSLADSGDVNSVTIQRVYQSDSGVRSLAVPVSNFGYDAQQSLLTVDSLSGVAAPYGLSGALPADIGAGSATIPLVFDTTGVGNGTANATITVNASDENIPGETQSTATINATIITRTLIADINGDCTVNLTDLSRLLSSFGACGGDPNYSFDVDLNNDNCVDLTDLSQLLSQFGVSC